LIKLNKDRPLSRSEISIMICCIVFAVTTVVIASLIRFFEYPGWFDTILSALFLVFAIITVTLALIIIFVERTGG